MNTELYKKSIENYETILAYYNLTRDKAIKYYNYISKFKELSSNYYSNIKELFNLDYNISDLNNDPKTIETIIIDYAISKNRSKSTYNVRAFQNDNMMKKAIKKQINIIPIQKSMNKINKLFYLHMQSIQLIIESLDHPLNQLNQNIEETQFEINCINNNYFKEKETFLEKYSEFELLNKTLKFEYEEGEKELIDFSLKKKSLNNKDEQNSLENEINLKLFDIKTSQKKIINKYKSFDKFGKTFNDCTNQKIKEITTKAVSLFEKFDDCLNNLLIFYKKSFLIPISNIQNQEKLLNECKTEFDELLKNNIQKIDEKVYKINFDEYQIKIIKKKDCISERQKIIKDLEIMTDNPSINLTDEDVFYIVKKMYNFNFINKKDYILNIEKEKLQLQKKIDILTSFSKYKINNLKKNNNNKNDNKEDDDKNKKEEDKKNEIKEEDDNNKNDSNNKNEIREEEEEEEDKDKKDESNKNENNSNLIDNNNNDDINKKDKNENNETNIKDEIIVKVVEPTQEDIDYIVKLMDIREYRLYFLTKINNFRATGVFSLPEKIFNYIITIFKFISKYLYFDEKKDNLDGNKEKKLDIEITKLVIILSQTFYCLKGDKKIYIQNELKNENIFHSNDFWKTMIRINIENEIIVCKKNDKNIGKEETEESILKRRNNISFAQIIPQISGMEGFGVKKEQMQQIILPFIDEYNISEENKKIILDIINNSSII